MSFSHRLSDLMTQRGISASALAETIGKSRQSVSYWLAGRNEPSPETLSKIAEALETTPLWLKTGEQSDTPAEIIQSSGDEPPDGYVRVPVYDVYAGCGFDGYAPPNDIVKGFLDIAASFLRKLSGVSSIARFNIVPSTGDSMEPTIVRDALCIVDKNQTEIRREGIYCLRSEDLLLIKRVQVNLDSTITLISDNSKYRDKTVPLESLDQTKIIGRVVYVFNGTHV